MPSHGLEIAMSGKWFNAIGYDVDKESELIDYDNVEKLALEHKPKLIIAGGSAYSRVIDFKRFREIGQSRCVSNGRHGISRLSCWKRLSKSS